MIQRIQTVFLLLVTALAVALFFFPVFVVTTTSPTMPAKAVAYMIQSNMMISIVVGLTGLIAFISIFLYGNRKRQALICRLNLLFIAGALGLILQASDTSSLPQSVERETIAYSFALCFPVLQMLFDGLALRFIKKDDDLVRSADRLR